jgi:poly(A) polymerase
MVNLRELLMGSSPDSTLRSLMATDELQKKFPYLAALRMAIPKGYHHKDNLVHSIKVLENAMAREGDTPDLILRTAALLHDVGKPATRKFAGRGAVTFTNHEMVGARMVKKLLKTEGYAPAEIAQVARLVALHMRSHGFHEAVWTDSAARRLSTDAGSSEVLERLLILFVADVTSAKPERVQKVHRSVEKLRELLSVVQAKDERSARRPAVDGHLLMEHFSLRPGRQVGRIMAYLNSDEGLALSQDDALAAAKRMLTEE